MDKLRESFHDVAEQEIRSMLGKMAVDVFGFDRELMQANAGRIGPQLSEIQLAP